MGKHFVSSVMIAAAVIAFAASAPASGQTAPSAQRVDPYKNFKYILIFGGRSVAGVSKASTDKGDIAEYRVGSDPLSFAKSPGHNKFEDIVLEGGVTLDTDFQQWANQAVRQSNAKVGSGAAQANLHDIDLEEFDSAGAIVTDFKLSNCVPVDYRPEPPRKDSSVTIDRFKIRCQKVTVESQRR